MGLAVLVLGESGSGKTYSLKNFGENELSIFSVEKGRLPFQKKFPMMKGATYTQIEETLKSPNKLAYAIDDSQYLLVNEMFDRAKEVGYQKWTDMAKSFRDLIHFVNSQLPDDVIVYFLHHTEVGADGRIKAKTVGKLLDNSLTVEGCFDIVLLTKQNGPEHIFETVSDGFTTAKSPEGMFEKIIPNDLKAVDTSIRDYYGMKKIQTKKESK